jgi:hypothetical protein
VTDDYQSLIAARRAFNRRRARSRALECFDQARDRGRAESMPSGVHDELRAKLDWADEHPNLLAVNVDVTLLKRLLRD